jgi:hypothetical protein
LAHLDALFIKPERAAEALDLIGMIYEVEREIVAPALSGQANKSYRRQRATPAVPKFSWVQRQFDS